MRDTVYFTLPSKLETEARELMITRAEELFNIPIRKKSDVYKRQLLNPIISLMGVKSNRTRGLQCET